MGLLIGYLKYPGLLMNLERQIHIFWYGSWYLSIQGQLLASSHLALCACATGRTFYFGKIDFHVSICPPNFSHAPTSIVCRTFHISLGTLLKTLV